MLKKGSGPETPGLAKKPRCHIIVILENPKKTPTWPDIKHIIYFETATFDRITKDRAAKFVDILSAIGGTMGLLTGFSIMSGIEIIFFFFKLIRSLRFTKGEKTNEKKWDDMIWVWNYLFITLILAVQSADIKNLTVEKNRHFQYFLHISCC